MQCTENIARHIHAALHLVRRPPPRLVGAAPRGHGGGHARPVRRRPRRRPGHRARLGVVGLASPSRREV